MKRTLHLILFLILINLTSTSQVIHGKVYDAKSKEAVRFANVYLEGTTIGTVTDKYGRFHFDIGKQRGIPIIISTIGYNSKRIQKFSNNQELIIYLNQKEYMLNETEIIAKRISKTARIRYLDEFKNEFLGSSRYLNQCEILNENDILFEYDKKNKTLYAGSKKPLIINNQGLGYQITYFLDSFISTKKMIFYDGYYFFSEIKPQSESEAEQIKDNRFKAYLGSRLALIRAMYEERLKQNLFSLYDTNYVELNLKKFINKLPNGDKELCLGQELIVHSGYQQFPQKSKLIPIESCIRITKNGYFNAKSIKWTDYISRKRVADLLPFEYQPSEKQKAAFDYMK